MCTSREMQGYRYPSGVTGRGTYGYGYGSQHRYPGTCDTYPQYLPDLAHHGHTPLLVTLHFVIKTNILSFWQTISLKIYSFLELTQPQWVQNGSHVQLKRLWKCPRSGEVVKERLIQWIQMPGEEWKKGRTIARPHKWQQVNRAVSTQTGDVEEPKESLDVELGVYLLQMLVLHCYLWWNRTHDEALDCPIYAFFSPLPSIQYVDGRHCHIFSCLGRHCKQTVRWYLNTGDKGSTSNLHKHVKSCWGEDTLMAVSDAANLDIAHDAVKKWTINSTITAAFK